MYEVMLLTTVFLFSFYILSIDIMDENRGVPRIVRTFRNNDAQHRRYLDTLRRVRAMLAPFLLNPDMRMEDMREHFQVNGVNAVARRLPGVATDIDSIEYRENYLREVINYLDMLVAAVPQAFLERIIDEN